MSDAAIGQVIIEQKFYSKAVTEPRVRTLPQSGHVALDAAHEPAQWWVATASEDYRVRDHEVWRNWLMGAVLGALSGLLIVMGGPVFVVLVVLLLPAGFVVARSIAYTSGSFVGFGIAWFAIAALPQAEALTWKSGVSLDIAIPAILVGIGAGAGLLALRRRDQKIGNV